MRLALLLLSAACYIAAPPVGQYRSAHGAPETFITGAQVKGGPGAAAAVIQVVIQRYTPEAERTAVERALALEGDGYPAFLTALRKSPEAGYVEHGTSKFIIRYAREIRTDKGRRIDVVTDRPIYFLGGGAPEPRPRAGFEVAALRIEVDEVGLGSGVMAAAARVKLAPDGGVQIEDYAEEPIKLATVRRKLS